MLFISPKLMELSVLLPISFKTKLLAIKLFGQYYDNKGKPIQLEASYKA